jgi:hypothetical protein
VAAGGRVARFDRVDRRLHEALEDLTNFVVKNRVFEGDPGLRRERFDELLAALVERDHAVLEVVATEQLLLRLLLLVDQLQHADDFTLARGERRHQHALAAVTHLVVERTIEAERRARRHFVDVVDPQRRLLERDVTRHAARADRHGEFARIERD